MNNASIETSERLQKVLSLLKRGGKFTTRQIIRLSGQCAINSIISEIRCAGIQVECERKGRYWYYWLKQS